MTKLMIGCPVQNRDWILPKYLEAIDNFVMIKDDIHLSFLVNNSTDETESILNEFKENNDDYYRKIDIKVDNSISFIDDMKPKNRDYLKIANIKNKFLQMRDNKDDFVLLIDSDTIAPPNTVLDLLYGNEHIIGGLVPQAQIKNLEFFNIMIKTMTGTYVHARDIYEPSYDVNERIPVSRYLEVDSIAGCVMYSREVLDKGIKFGYHKQGEDIALCEAAKKLNYKIFCDVYVLCKHYMSGRNKFNDEFPGSHYIM